MLSGDARPMTSTAMAQGASPYQRRAMRYAIQRVIVVARIEAAPVYAMSGPVHPFRHDALAADPKVMTCLTTHRTGPTKSAGPK